MRSDDWPAVRAIHREGIATGNATFEVEPARDWAVFPENEATIRLHRAAGFREVGRRERIGEHHGRWRDTVLLERRSERAG